MRVVVVSDTHGYIQPVIQWIQSQEGMIDEIWHLGDYYKDAQKLKATFSIPIYMVKGNCDVGVKGRDHIVLERFGKRIVLTHGHLEHVKNGLTTLYVFAQSQQADLICFGHTHEAVLLHEGGLYLFNPGSPTHPRLGKSFSIGVVEVDEEGLGLSHFNL